MLDLEPSTQYYVNVRAVTGAGNALDAASDGVMIDVSEPSVSDLGVGQPITGSEVQSPGSVVYQKDPDAIPAQWEVQEGESPVTELTARLGTVPGKCMDLQQ